MKKTFELKRTANLDVIAKSWLSNGLRELTPNGAFAINAAHKVTRISANELQVITTEQSVLTFIVKHDYVGLGNTICNQCGHSLNNPIHRGSK